MKSGIHISRVWSDDDVVELRIAVSDGTSVFSNKAYVEHAALEDAVPSLHVFKDHVHGGLLNLQFGEFGPQHASGAFHGRFHFPVPSRLFVSCEQESEFVEFARRRFASRATMHVSQSPRYRTFLSPSWPLCLPVPARRRILKRSNNSMQGTALRAAAEAER